MYLETKVERLNNQLQAKIEYESSHKDRLKLVRDELKEVCMRCRIDSHLAFNPYSFVHSG